MTREPHREWHARERTVPIVIPYRRVFRHLPQPALVLTPGDRLADANDAALTLFGGRSPSRRERLDQVSAALGPWLCADVDAFCRSCDEARTYEKEHQGFGQSPRYYRVRLARLESSDARLGVIVILTDITERRRTLEEIARLAVIVDSSDDAIVSIALDGRILSANRAAGRNYGYDPEALRGMSIFALVPDGLEGEMHFIFDEIAAGRPVSRYETLRRHSSGTVFPVSVTYSPIFRDGRVRAISAISRDITSRKRVEGELQRTNENLNQLIEETVKALSATLEKRDLYTSGHQQMVSRLSCLLAGRMGMNAAQVETVRIAGLLHDMGKVCVPMAILSKPARLSPGELALMRQHPETGFEILRNIPFPWPVGLAVLEHHERMDGTGYPRGLSGEDILPEAQVLAVADVLEAMSSHRPYRPALGLACAMEEIGHQAGATLDREVCRAARALVDEHRVSEIRGELTLCP